MKISSRSSSSSIVVVVVIEVVVVVEVVVVEVGVVQCFPTQMLITRECLVPGEPTRASLEEEEEEEEEGEGGLERRDSSMIAPASEGSLIIHQNGSLTGFQLHRVTLSEG